jgi:MoaD family protein
VKVRLFAGLRAVVGQPSIEVEIAPGATVRELIDRLVAEHSGLAPELLDEAGELSRRVSVIVDGRNVVHLPRGFATPLAGPERIHIFPAVAGG